MAEINATPADALANSYATVAEADAFLLEERLGGSAWDAVTDKPAALIMATQQIDRLSFIGTIVSTAQSLQWPRSGAVLPDGRLLASNAIPVGVNRATCEMALWLTQGDRTAVSGGEAMSEVKVGSIELSFRDPQGTGDILSTMPDVVRGHLNGYTPLPLSGGGINHGVLRR